MISRLTAIVHDQTGDTGIVLTEDMLLLSDLGLNSFDLINLVCAVEDEFGIEIPDREIKKFKSVGDVIAYIEAQ